MLPPKFHDHQHIEVIPLRTRYTSRLNPENNGGTRNVPQPRLSRDLLALSLSVPAAAAESAHHQSQTWHHHHRVGRQTDRRPSARSSGLVFVGARHTAGSILRRNTGGQGPKTVKGAQSDPNYVSRLLLDCVPVFHKIGTLTHFAM